MHPFSRFIRSGVVDAPPTPHRSVTGANYVLTDDDLDALDAEKKRRWRGYNVAVITEEPQYSRRLNRNVEKVTPKTTRHDTLEAAVSALSHLVSGWEWADGRPPLGPKARAWLTATGSQNPRTGEYPRYTAFITRLSGEPLTSTELSYIEANSG